MMENSPSLNPRPKSKSLAIWLTGMVILVLTCGGLYVAGWLARGWIGEGGGSDARDRFVGPLEGFTPKVFENRVYLLTLFLGPFLMLVLAGKFRHTLQGVLEKRAGFRGFLAVAGSLALTGLLVASCGTGGFEWVAVATSERLFPVANLGMVLILALAAVLPVSKTGFLKWFRTYAAPVLESTLVAFLLVSILLYPVLSENHPYLNGTHFEVVFYPVYQVWKGGTLLAGLKSQYGLFPHFLEPFFHLIGLTATRFTLALAVLNAMTFAGLYVLLRKLVQSRCVRMVGFMAVVYAAYFARKLWLLEQGGADYVVEPYFQYHPVRTLIPVTTLLLGSAWFANPTRLTYFATFAIGAMGILWNLDTGFVAWFAWLLTLLFHGAVFGNGQKLRAGMAHFGYAGASLVFALGVAAAFVYLRSGVAPRLSEIFFYQQVFYGGGYGLGQMQLLHPWIGVGLALLGALTSVAMALRNGFLPRFPTAPTILQIALVGCGLFAYYQARSEDDNLHNVLYPALVLAVIALDQILALAAQPGPERWKTAFLSAPLVLVISSMAGAMVVKSPLLRRSFIHAAALREPMQPKAEMPWQGFLSPSEKTIIFSYNSARLHLLTGTPAAARDSFYDFFDPCDFIQLYRSIDQRQAEALLIAEDFLDKHEALGMSWGPRPLPVEELVNLVRARYGRAEGIRSKWARPARGGETELVGVEIYLRSLPSPPPVAVETPQSNGILRTRGCPGG